jgi:hypothetical protein
MKPVDILEMAKPEIEAQKKKGEIINKLRELKRLGKTDSEIAQVIHSLNLPLGLHLYILGNFSKLIR